MEFIQSCATVCVCVCVHVCMCVYVCVYVCSVHTYVAVVCESSVIVYYVISIQQ